MKVISKHIPVSSLLRVLCVLALIAPASLAQGTKGFATKGCIEVGGSVAFQSLAFTSSQYSGDTFTSLSLAPFIGYFTSDNIEIALNPLSVMYTSSGGTQLLN